MPQQLAKALLRYSSALTCMQQLEAQHHYLNQKISFGRASLPASTCAHLRRRMNPDVFDPYLRKHIARLIGDIYKLVVTKWDSRGELIQQVYGFSLESLHSNAEEMQRGLQEAKSMFQKQQQSLSTGAPALENAERQIRHEHATARMSTGRYYRLTNDDNSTIVFQVICKHPERRSYVQRICSLGQDASRLLLFSR